MLAGLPRSVLATADEPPRPDTTLEGLHQPEDPVPPRTAEEVLRPGQGAPPAFVVNRLLTRFLGDITAAVDEGTPVQVAERAPEPLGLPMSPFVLLQLVGPAIALHVTETLHAAFPDRFVVSPNLRELVGSGKTAIYRADLTLDPEVVGALAGGDRLSRQDQVRQRALEGLAEEIRLMLGEGVVAAPEDIDLCMILGAGWPFHLGGITPYLDRAGIAEKVNGSRFRPV